MNNKRKGLIIFLILSITVLHYFTTMSDAPLHEFYRELYFIPAVLAGLWGGKKQGLTASLFITILFLPHMLHSMGTTISSLLVNISEVILFNMAGFLTGIYKDTKQGYVTTLSKPYRPMEIKKNFLLFIDGTSASLYAANYFARVFGRIPDIGITLLWIFGEIDADAFESSDKAAISNKQKYLHEEGLLKQTKEILLQGDVPEGNIKVKTLSKSSNERISDVIMKELMSGDYDSVVIGKHPQTRSQEFLLGSTTIRLVRESPVHVIAVKMPANITEDSTVSQNASGGGKVEVIE